MREGEGTEGSEGGEGGRINSGVGTQAVVGAESHRKTISTVQLRQGGAGPVLPIKGVAYRCRYGGVWRRTKRKKKRQVPQKDYLYGLEFPRLSCTEPGPPSCS